MLLIYFNTFVKCCQAFFYFSTNFFVGAEDRNRTGTVVSNRGILSPVRLPVPPPRQQFFGAGDGNRTHVTSLEGWGSTIELHPQVINGAGERN